MQKINKKGEMGEVGMFLVIGIGVIVTAILLIAIAQQVGETRNIEQANYTITTPSPSGILDLTGVEYMELVSIINATSGETINAANYTIDEGLSSTTNAKTIRYTSLAAGSYNDSSVNITYNYGGSGYIENSGARAIAYLIVVFAALAIAAFALLPALRSKVISY